MLQILRDNTDKLHKDTLDMNPETTNNNIPTPETTPQPFVHPPSQTAVIDSLPEPPVTEFPATIPQKKSRKKLIITLIIVIVLAAAGGVATYIMATQKNTSSTEATTTATTSGSSSDEAMTSLTGGAEDEATIVNSDDSTQASDASNSAGTIGETVDETAF